MDIIVLPFVEQLRKFISVPFLKVARSVGKAYISGRSGMSGYTPAETG